jgi:hypothetical protein
VQPAHGGMSETTLCLKIFMFVGFPAFIERCIAG